MADYDIFVRVFGECAPNDAILVVDAVNAVASATIHDVSGMSMTFARPITGEVRSAAGNAASLAEACWEFVESHHAARKLSDIRAQRRNEDFEIMRLERLAARYQLSPLRGEFESGLVG